MIKNDLNQGWYLDAELYPSIGSTSSVKIEKGNMVTVIICLLLSDSV